MTRVRGLVALTVLAVLLLVRLALPVAAQGAAPRSFPSPEDAVRALIEAVKKGNLDDLVAIFGAEGRELVAGSDPATGRQHREVFNVAVAERWRLTDASSTQKTLVIGYEDWPFPVPIVKAGGKWRFDTAAGKEEVIARRIGRNERAAIETCRAYVTAQQRYAAQAHDGKPVGLYAATFHSDPGKENGLYWPAARGQKRSPLGDLVAQAAEEANPLTTERERPAPLHGYYFRILTAQGSAAPGGAKNYIVNGALTGGFALVAWPAQYDVTGVMTFVVNQDGIVREKDLGRGTDAAARHMTAYSPDASWRPAR
jgi:hypothetical protein